MSCALVDLEPEWIERDGRVVGVMFSCPTCSRWGANLQGTHSVGVLFANPPDGGPPTPNSEDVIANYSGRRWMRSGTTFADLSIMPSIDLSRGRPGEWHGFVVAGRVT